MKNGKVTKLNWFCRSLQVIFTDILDCYDYIFGHRHWCDSGLQSQSRNPQPHVDCSFVSECVL